MKLAGTVNVFPFLPTATCVPCQPSVSNDKRSKCLVASTGYYMLITTKYAVNATTWWNEGNTQKHAEGKSATTRKRSRRIRDLGSLFLASVLY